MACPLICLSRAIELLFDDKISVYEADGELELLPTMEHYVVFDRHDEEAGVELMWRQLRMKIITQF